MNNRLKEFFLGTVLMFVCNVFSMDSNSWSTESPSFDANEKDSTGCTPLHHVMICKDATVGHVALCIKLGADVNIQNKNGRDPYGYSFNYQGYTPDGSKPLHNCNNKVVHFLHSEMLSSQLEELAFKQRAGIKY